LSHRCFSGKSGKISCASLKNCLLLHLWPNSQAAEGAIPHLCKQEWKRPTPVRRQLSRTHAFFGRAIPGRCVPMSRMTCSLLRPLFLGGRCGFTIGLKRFKPRASPDVTGGLPPPKQSSKPHQIET